VPNTPIIKKALKPAATLRLVHANIVGECIDLLQKVMVCSSAKGLRLVTRDRHFYRGLKNRQENLRLSPQVLLLELIQFQRRNKGCDFVLVKVSLFRRISLIVEALYSAMWAR
jgi:hypothetical protein